MFAKSSSMQPKTSFQSFSKLGDPKWQQQWSCNSAIVTYGFSDRIGPGHALTQGLRGGARGAPPRGVSGGAAAERDPRARGRPRLRRREL